MKNLTLGVKIALGFGILILIAGALGSLGVLNMKGVEGDSKMLANEFVPEVDVAVELRGAANRIMYELRGYGFTEEKKYYDNALKEFQAADDALEKARELEKKSPNLKKLKGQIKIASAAIEEYKALAEQTMEINEKLAVNRKILDESAASYMQNSNDFLAGQNDKLKVELNERQKKIEMVTELVKIGSETRVTNFKSQALKDPQLMTKALDKLKESGRPIKDLRKITRDPNDIEMINNVEAAADGYQTAMRFFLREFRNGSSARNSILKEHRLSMDSNAAKYVKNCDEFLSGQQQKLTHDITERNNKITIVNDIIDMGNATRIGAFKSQALRNPAVMEEALKNFPKINSKFKDLREITRLSEDLKRIDEVEVAAESYKTGMTDFLKNWLILQGLGAKRAEAGKSVIEACKTTADAGMEATKSIAKGAVSSLSAASMVMMTGLAIALVVGILVAFFITRSITGPVNRVIGDLTEASDQVASASGQVSSSSQQLAEGASEQAASIEETSSSLEEMSSMTKQNAKNASQADNLMKESNQIVNQANDSMNDLTTSMEEISKASEETSKIIKTIDEIAFQTNLLALNAAVEAARAGEAGAGFAVVADEVRNLAMRAADAAKNTADLIEGTVKKVGDGSDLVTRTNEAFSKVAESSKKVGELVGEISAASNEQSEGIEQVNKAVTEMDKVVQLNAANAEESASASEEMSAQAEQMKSSVGELIALVGGGSGNGNGHAKTVFHSKNHMLNHVQKSQEPENKNFMTPKDRKIKPDQMIPMDNDFTEF